MKCQLIGSSGSSSHVYIACPHHTTPHHNTSQVRVLPARIPSPHALTALRLPANAPLRHLRVSLAPHALLIVLIAF
eukprot:299194-Rhodomonas_salina.5